MKFNFKSKKPTRSEKIKICIKLKYEKYQQVSHLIKQICGVQLKTTDGETVTFSYKFIIDYFDNVERDLNQILTILNETEDSVLSVDSRLLDKTTCLITCIVEKLRKLQIKIKYG